MTRTILLAIALATISCSRDTTPTAPMHAASAAQLATVPNAPPPALGDIVLYYHAASDTAPAPAIVTHVYAGSGTSTVNLQVFGARDAAAPYPMRVRFGYREIGTFWVYR
jgi:hypothetical protein